MGLPGWSHSQWVSELKEGILPNGLLELTWYNFFQHLSVGPEVLLTGGQTLHVLRFRKFPGTIKDLPSSTGRTELTHVVLEPS